MKKSPVTLTDLTRKMQSLTGSFSKREFQAEMNTMFQESRYLNDGSTLPRRSVMCRLMIDLYQTMDQYLKSANHEPAH